MICLQGVFLIVASPCHVELSADDICKWTQIYPMSIQGIPLIGGTLQTGFGHLGQGRFLLKQSRGKFFLIWIQWKQIARTMRNFRIFIFYSLKKTQKRHNYCENCYKNIFLTTFFFNLTLIRVSSCYWLYTKDLFIFTFSRVKKFYQCWKVVTIYITIYM